MAGRALVFVLLALFSCLMPSIAAAENEAVVISRTLVLRASETNDSAVITTLKRGETVSIDSESLDGSWCFVRDMRTSFMGYAPCNTLKRKAMASRGDYSDVRVLLYMTEW